MRAGFPALVLYLEEISTNLPLVQNLPNSNNGPKKCYIYTKDGQKKCYLHIDYG